MSAANAPAEVPNFLLIGVPRSGTTTVYQFLLRHPDVAMSSIKEPMFFICEGEPDPTFGSLIAQPVADWNSYQALFRSSGEAKAYGEASTFYLYSATACARIAERLPHAKLIVILRHPVERAYSHFMINRLRGVEPLADFGAALDAEEDRIRQGWFMYYFYRDVGFYGGQIQRYLRRFSREQILFILFDELRRSPGKTMRQICRFLDISEPASPELSTRYNASGVPRHRHWYEFLTGSNPLKTLVKRVLPESIQFEMLSRLNSASLVKPPLSDSIRFSLLETYREDILRTQEMTRLDLSAWLKA